MQRRLDPETGVNKLFENVSCQERISNFFRKWAPISVTFSSVVFSAELISSNLSTKNDSRGVRGHAPRKIFENLHTVMAILVLFKQFLDKLCHIFWPLSLSASPMMHFVCTVLIMRA